MYVLGELDYCCATTVDDVVSFEPAWTSMWLALCGAPWTYGAFAVVCTSALMDRAQKPETGGKLYWVPYRCNLLAGDVTVVQLAGSYRCRAGAQWLPVKNWVLPGTAVLPISSPNFAALVPLINNILLHLFQTASRKRHHEG